MMDLASSATKTSPRICFVINNGSAIGDDVLPSLPIEAQILVYDGPLAAFPVPIANSIQTTDRLVGSLVGADDHPPLADVIAFARSNLEARGALADFARSVDAAQTDPNPETILDRLFATMKPTELDLVIIDDPLLAGSIVTQLVGAKVFLVAGASKTFGGVTACRALSASSEYTRVSVDHEPDGDWAFFHYRTPPLPVHFVTIVQNSAPLLSYHQLLFTSLAFEWHWHVVDDLADLSKRQGSLDPDEKQQLNRAPFDAPGVDDIHEYLSDLSARFPDRVTIHRPEIGQSWASRSQMLNMPLSMMDGKALLWQVETSELWTSEQIIAVRDAFLAEPDRTAAWFWSRYFVGPQRAISTRYNYANDPQHDGLRVWRFEPGMTWTGDDQPKLQARDGDDTSDVGRHHPFSHGEMEARGAVFEHVAYAINPQGALNQRDAGDDTVRQWLALQQAPATSVHLRDYLEWVTDETMVDTVERLGWAPLALFDTEKRSWRFRGPAELAELRDLHRQRAAPLIVVDGVFFQLSDTGIARLWTNLLREWCRSGFGDRVVLLDRGGTAPRIDGVRYHSIEPHSWTTIDGDARYLQDVCDRLDATLFLSTYYTTPLRTPTVFIGYDMIPEALGIDRDDVWWSQKRRAIMHAKGWVMISRSSASELTRHFRS